MHQLLNLLENELVLLEIKYQALIDVDEESLDPYAKWIAREIFLLKGRISDIRLKLFPPEDAEDL